MPTGRASAIEQASPGGRSGHRAAHERQRQQLVGSSDTLRGAGATAREMLVSAAAARGMSIPASCQRPRGIVTTADRTPAAYGQLAAAAARPGAHAADAEGRHRVSLARHADETRRRPRDRHRQAAVRRDVRVPGMLYATIERAPTLGATLGIRCDRRARVPGVRHVVAVTRGIHPGVAVVATDTWSALRGRRALRIDWRPGAGAPRSTRIGFSTSCGRSVRSCDLQGPPRRRRPRGDDLVGAAVRSDLHLPLPGPRAARDDELHRGRARRLAPSSGCRPRPTSGRCSRRQRSPAWRRRQITHALSCWPAAVSAGGCSRISSAEAAEISKAIGQPVQLLWTREDDMRHGYFQPATGELVRGRARRERRAGRAAAQDAAPASRSTTSTAGPEHLDAAKRPNAPTTTSRIRIRGARTINRTSSGTFAWTAPTSTSPVPVGPWRAVEYPSTVFGRESFLDEWRTPQARIRSRSAWRSCRVT